ncbi:glycoside hydrolase family 16 protein [Balneolaceae bacterium YR4-1]|uniref:Glycoside hydrolase family 16 protein n=1 Tax=Halalkalibaculum roseum TaxID=2709311 RepID=A0A6M1SR80_9BACT|nr:glycoside hydrolase family 16 protein [Halalkalibaculum roseum]NGP75320.1 glycoside hydrolase family 16 protein [Halalkalibaculum roseum]
MKYFLYTLLIAVFASCGSDNPGNGFDYDENPPVDDTVQSGDLIWSDEFNTDGQPSSSNWTYDIGHGEGGWGNNEVQYYTDESKNVRVENGNLIIDALKENGEWTSARIKTQGKQNFRYVTVKVRAKLPQGSGTWPAIWMLGSDITDAGWPACGEVDIMEHVGKDPGMVHGSLHSPSSYGNTQNSGSTEVTDFSEAFHVYEVEWTTNRITFKIDGTAFYSYEPSVKNDQTWPYNDDFFIIMNIAMGGNWGSDAQYESGGMKNGIDPNLNQARMEIDYIRVYKS